MLTAVLGVWWGWIVSPVAAGDTPAPAAYQVGQILDTRTGQPVDLPVLLDQLARQDVVYLGEEHRNHAHISLALKVLDGLLERHRRPQPALEMFAWDGQSALDNYTGGGMSRSDFLRDSHWDRNWGGKFDDYEPLVEFAREHKLRVLALNPPRPLVRLVATKGLETARTDPQMALWAMQDERFPDDPAYRDVIVKPLRLCHGGLSDQDYQRMYEASVFRDEGMARTIVRRLQEQSRETPRGAAGPVVSYTGGGHVQYGLPVPNRVLRRLDEPINQLSIYFTAFDPERGQEIEELVRDHIADYVWLTPLGAEGPPRRCR